MAAVLEEVDSLASAKAKLAKQFSGNFDPRLGDIYIAPLGAEQETASEENSFPLLGEVARRLTETPLRSLLLLGNSGMGKTCLSLRFCKMVWEMMAEGEDYPLPLYIYLPQYKEQLQQGLLEQVLRDADLSNEECRVIRRQSLLLILDGFDEVSVNDNLYQSQGWGQSGFNIRILVSCRPEALLNKNPQALLEAGEYFAAQGPSYQTLYLQTFNDKQIKKYLQTYLDKDAQSGEVENADEKEKETESEGSGDKSKGKEEDVQNSLSLEDYLAWLERLPSLKTLVKTPFLLKVVAQALPSIIQDLSEVGDDEIARKQFTQNELFRRFLDDWFFKQAQRVKVQGLLKELSHEELAGYMRAYAQNLASSRMGLDGQLDESPLTEEQCLRPEFVEPVHNKKLLKLYHHSNPDLRQSRLFFTEDEEGKKRPIREHLQAVRSGCLLHTIGERFKFLHKSITEYLAARELMEGLLGNYDRYLETLLGESPETEGRGLNQVLLTKEPEMIKRLAEAAAADSGFRQLLDDILMASKDTLGLGIAAANAITVLNYAGVDFSGCDLSEVQISGADLSAGTFAGTNFKGANLSNVNFSQTCLMYTDWCGAEVANINFGERAYFTLPWSITCVAAYYPNADTLHWLVGCIDGYVYHFDDTSGKQLESYSHNSYFDDALEALAVHVLAVHSTSHLLVTAGENKKLRLWNLKKGNTFKELRKHPDSVRSIALSADGKWLVSASWHMLCLWHLPQDSPVIVLTNTDIKIDGKCVALSANGEFLVWSSWKKLCLWHVPEGSPKAVLEHMAEVTCVMFSADGKLLVSGSEDGMLRLWYLPYGSPGAVLTGHKGEVKCATLNADGKLLVSSDYQTLRLWHLPHGSPGPVLIGPEEGTNCIALSVDGRLLVSGGGDNMLRRWHLPQVNLGAVLTGHTAIVTCVMLSDDGSLLVSGSIDGTLRLWHLPEGKPGPVLRGHRAVRYAALSVDGKLLVSLGMSDTLYLWCLSERNPRVMLKERKGYTCATFSADGKMLALGTSYGCLHLWHLSHGKSGTIFTKVTKRKEIDANPKHKEIRCVVFSADGKLLISGGGERKKETTLRLWYLPEGSPGPVLKGHTWPVLCATLSADGKFLVSGSGDNTLRLWQLPQGSSRAVLTGHTQGVKCVAISADGRFVVSGSRDKTLRFWALPSGTLLSVLPVGFVVTSFAMKDTQLIVSGGHGFLLSIHINIADLKNLRPRFDWLRRGTAYLCLQDLHIQEALHLSPANQALCEQRGSVGKANPNMNAPYQAWCSLFKPIVGVL